MKRLLRRKEAAEYCGLSIAAFERAMIDGTLPYPVKIEGQERWCIKALDKALDRLTGAAERPAWEIELERRYGPQAA